MTLADSVSVYTADIMNKACKKQLT